MTNTMQDAHNLIDNTELLDRMGYEVFESTVEQLTETYNDLRSQADYHIAMGNFDEAGQVLIDLLDTEHLMTCAGILKR